eukprot:270744-Pelagomonas_calceolata.AAC.2
MHPVPPCHTDWTVSTPSYWANSCFTRQGQQTFPPQPPQMRIWAHLGPRACQCLEQRALSCVGHPLRIPRQHAKASNPGEALLSFIDQQAGPHRTDQEEQVIATCRMQSAYHLRLQRQQKPCLTGNIGSCGVTNPSDVQGNKKIPVSVWKASQVVSGLSYKSSRDPHTMPFADMYALRTPSNPYTGTNHKLTSEGRRHQMRPCHQKKGQPTNAKQLQSQTCNTSFHAGESGNYTHLNHGMDAIDEGSSDCKPKALASPQAYSMRRGSRTLQARIHHHGLDSTNPTKQATLDSPQAPHLPAPEAPAQALASTASTQHKLSHQLLALTTSPTFASIFSSSTSVAEVPAPSTSSRIYCQHSPQAPHPPASSAPAQVWQRCQMSLG